MADPADIKSRLTTIFRTIFDDESIDIHDQMTAADIDEWDSLNHINLIIAVERSFGVRFTTSEVSNVANVGEFIDILRGKLTPADGRK